MLNLSPCSRKHLLDLVLIGGCLVSWQIRKAGQPPTLSLLEDGSVGFEKDAEISLPCSDGTAVNIILANSLEPLESSAVPPKTVTFFPGPDVAKSRVTTTDI